MNLSSVHSVVIGPKQINYCNITKKGKSNILNAIAYYDFNSDKFEELEGIIDSISETVGKSALFNISVIDTSVIKHIYFYKKGAINIKANILRDLKNDYEIQLKDYLIDYEEEELEDKKVAFVVAYPKSSFEKLYKYFKKHKNIKLFSLEAGIVSIKRLINSLFAEDKTRLCIRMDKSFSNIFVLHKDSVVVDRELQYGFDNFLRDIVENGGTDEKTALDVIQNIGLYQDEHPTEEETNAYEIISSSFDKISIEIQRTIDYISSGHKIRGVDKMITLGFINKIKKSDIYLSKLFSIKADKLEASKAVEFDSSIDFSMVNDMLYFDVAVGAAMRSLK